MCARSYMGGVDLQYIHVLKIQERYHICINKLININKLIYICICIDFFTFIEC